MKLPNRNSLKYSMCSCQENGLYEQSSANRPNVTISRGRKFQRHATQAHESLLFLHKDNQISNVENIATNPLQLGG